LTRASASLLTRRRAARLVVFECIEESAFVLVLFVLT
jgi:hypothetical protein